jgi:hypothetical protein
MAITNDLQQLSQLQSKTLATEFKAGWTFPTRGRAPFAKAKIEPENRNWLKIISCPDTRQMNKAL